MEKHITSTDDMRINNMFSPGYTMAWKYLIDLIWPWEALSLISSYVNKLGAEMDTSEYDIRPDNVWIHETANIAPSAYIGSNVIIGAKVDVRHNAFIRQDVIVGDGAVVGNSTELKNVILFNEVQVPHFNYVGDSILGYKSHFGAGVITSNVKSDSSPVKVLCGCEQLETGRKKFGAILGDNVEIGCNAVLNPGTVIGSNTTVYPLSMVRGFVPAGSIYKNQGEIVEKR